MDEERMYKGYVWNTLRTHYNEIKDTYQLTYTDLLRQLGLYPYDSYINKLYNTYGNIPSSRMGTSGIQLWNTLIDNLNKTDWQPSNATYTERLNENIKLGINNFSIYEEITNTSDFTATNDISKEYINC